MIFILDAVNLSDIVPIFLDPPDASLPSVHQLSFLYISDHIVKMCLRIVKESAQWAWQKDNHLYPDGKNTVTCASRIGGRLAGGSINQAVLRGVYEAIWWLSKHLKSRSINVMLFLYSLLYLNDIKNNRCTGLPVATQSALLWELPFYTGLEYRPERRVFRGLYSIDKIQEVLWAGRALRTSLLRLEGIWGYISAEVYATDIVTYGASTISLPIWSI